MKNFVHEFLATGFLRNSTSSANAPILFVKKNDGTLRPCNDYRGLNDITIKDRYPLPLINDMFDQIRGATVFSKIDLRGAYNLVRIKEGDEWKTAFRTKYGHFEYQVMPFGLTNAPAAFQRLMNDTLKDMLDKFAICLLDDIGIYSQTREEHIVHVRAVLEALRQRKLYAKFSKCEFFKDEIVFLGHTVSAKGIEMCQDKVKSILEWPILESRDNILSFLGLANYYRRFIDNFSKITFPLTQLLKKETKFVWGEEQQHAFDELKRQFTKSPILTFADPEKPYIVETDASDLALGAVLIQTSDKGIGLPIAFYSRKLIPAELNYEVYDKELLAIIEAFANWRQYLMGAKHSVQVFSDHKTLEYFMKTKTLTRRQARWALFLSEFSFVIHYKKGSANIVADALSRRHDYTLTEQDKAFQTTSLLSPAHFAQLRTMTTLAVQLMSKIRTATETDLWAQKQLENETNEQDSPVRFTDGILFYDGLVYVPDSPLRLEILQAHHDQPLAGHFGHRKTLDLIQREYYWPLMSAMVKNYIDSCDICKRVKTSRHKPYGLLQPLPIGQRPWGSISLDFIGPLPTSQGYNAILNVVDRLVKMAHFIPCTTKINATGTITLMQTHIIRLHGLPDDIVSDRGPQFNSKVWLAWCEQNSITVKRSTAFHPQTDGQTERTNQTLEQYLRSYINYLQTDWANLLPVAEFAYNNSYHTAIKCSPFFALYGHHPRMGLRIPTQELDLIVPSVEEKETRMKTILSEAQKHLEAARTAMKHSADLHRLQTPAFEVGEKVWLANKNFNSQRPSQKLDFKNIGPFTILAKLSDNTFKLELPTSMNRTHDVFHASLLEKHVPNTFVGRTVPPPLPVIVEDELEFEVEKILDSAIKYRKVRYLVKWKGYGNDEWTWAKPDDLTNCLDMVNEFHIENPDKPNGFKKLTKDLARGGSVRTRVSPRRGRQH